MRRLTVLFVICLALLTTALPALAQEDPLAHSVLLPNIVGWGMVGAAVMLVIIFRLWSRRGPQ